MAKYSYKKNHPFLTFLVVLLILVLLATVFAFLWKLSDGFKDWSWFTGDDETLEVSDDVVEEISDEYDSEDVVISYGFTPGESVVAYSE